MPLIFRDVRVVVRAAIVSSCGQQGDELTAEALSALIHGAKDTITCVGFMGGDGDPAAVDLLAKYVQERHNGLKVGWYTGRTAISPLIDQQHFDYIKVGPYLRHLGGLDSPRTINECTAAAQMEALRISLPAFGNIRQRVAIIKKSAPLDILL